MTQYKNLVPFSLIFLSFISCNIKNDKEGFSEPREVNYSLKYFQTNSYPIEIDKKISNEDNPNFSDSLKEKKTVFAIVKYNYRPNTKKVQSIDTSGYFVSMTNDSSELFWEIDFDSHLRITRSEEITFQEQKRYEEGVKKNGR